MALKDDLLTPEQVYAVRSVLDRETARAIGEAHRASDLLFDQSLGGAGVAGALALGKQARDLIADLGIDPSSRAYYRDALLDSSPGELLHRTERTQLRAELEAAKSAWKADKSAWRADKEGRQAAEQEVARLAEALRQEETLGFITDRIQLAARPVLLASPDLQQRFMGEHPSDAYVVAIDIRRSTELMLKAQEPKLYATFITDLCQELRDVVFRHDGVFDKFTGDGVLAFFPEFFSGEDAGYRAIMAALECHAVFAKSYEDHRSSFTAVSLDAGLGIGIDFGRVTFTRIGSELMVVGRPVVYACRFSGAPAGTTLLNQMARDQIVKRYEKRFSLGPTAIDTKNEGRQLAYSVQWNGEVLQDLTPAAWRKHQAPAAPDAPG